MLQDLYSFQITIAKSISLRFKRYLYNTISWDKRLIAIIGSRGTGKTTLVLQYYIEQYNDPDRCLYISADNPLVLKEGIFAITREFFTNNGECIIIDEVHKQINWGIDIKALYDSFPDKKIIILGSSALSILDQKSDLSRRLLIYKLPHLSFREYLNMKHDLSHESYSLKGITTNHLQISRKITQSYGGIFKEFKDYCSFGSYPFFIEYNEEEYHSVMHNILDKVIYEDIPSIHSIRTASSMKLKKLLGFLAMSKIPLFNVDTLCNEIQTTRDSLYEFFDFLERADLISIVRPEKKNLRGIKNSKILFRSPNLYFSIAQQLWKHDIEQCNIRESFAAGCFTEDYSLFISTKTDFIVYDRDANEYEIEVGGKHKGQKQIQGLENGYIFKDNIEHGHGKTIPLYLAGFLY